MLRKKFCLALTLFTIIFISGCTQNIPPSETNIDTLRRRPTEEIEEQTTITEPDNVGEEALAITETVIEEDDKNLDEDENDGGVVYYPVIEIIDGDTIRIELEEKIKTVRLIGVDTPETVHPTKKVQCFGKEASKFTKALLTNEFVYLETDSQSDNLDKYGRLLRYVYTADDLFVNALLIEQGYAYAYTRFPFDYMSEFVSLEENAREQGLGLWGGGGC